jgi:sugar/nucleoside kinase (ribokinase family)
MSEAKTLDTQLNVFESFAPKIPDKYLESDFVFLANIQPTLQLQVREQLPHAKLVALDTMNYWINGTPEELRRTLSRVDLLVINDKEARMLAGIDNLRRAAAAVRKMGPRWLVVKRGEFGACLFQEDSIFFVPGYPLEEVHDPTGAGDTFAGGLMGHLTRTGDLSDRNLRQALVYGSVMASFAVEEFGMNRLLKLTSDEIARRFNEFKAMTHFDV